MEKIRYVVDKLHGKSSELQQKGPTWNRALLPGDL